MDPNRTPGSSPPQWEQIDRYLAGQPSADDLDDIRRYGLEHTDVVARLKRVADVYAATQGDTPAVEALWERMSARIEVSPSVTSPGRRVGARKTVWYSVAGAVCGIVLLMIGWNSGVAHRQAGISSQMFTYTTGNGQRSTITLPDGSRAELNVGSRLEIPVNYNQGSRTIRLSGEALFTVQPRSASPFIVKAGSSTTRVLGTQFVVRKYPDDSTARIAVREGKVAVGETTLTKMQQIVVGASGHGLVQPASAARFSFASDMLVLDSVPLSTAINDLNRWYDADIRLGDQVLGARRIVGGFTSGSLTDLVAILQRTFNVTVVRDGRRLTLYPGS